MRRSRLTPVALLTLVTAGLGVSPALAQVAGQVGQPVDPGLLQGTPLRRGPVPATLPTLDEDTKTQDTQRKAQESQRATAAAGAQPVTGRVRYPTQKQVRAMRNLTRPPNRVVLPPAAPLPQAQNPATASFQPQNYQQPVVVSPGLSELPPAKKKKLDAEKDPYAPLGLRLEGFTVLPAVEASAGYDTNPLRAASGTARINGSKVYQIAPELSVQSDWSRHSLQLDLKGTYNFYSDVDNANRPTLDGKLTLKGDIRQTSQITLELKEKIDSQRPGSVDLTNAVKGRPLYFTSGGSLAWAEKFGYATVTATGSIDRSDYMDGTTYAGATYSQQDKNYTAYGTKLRGAYELTPGLSPFVEVGGDVREYDLKYDAGNYRRSSRGATAKVGSTVELSRVLTGEVSAGWGLRQYDDSRLGDLSGLLADASLVWLATPLTKVTAKAGTEFIETVQNGSPGAVSRKASLEVAHDVLRNMTLTSTAAFSRADYKGINRIEDTLSAGLRADYKIDRMFVVRGSYAYERALSSTPGASTLAHVFLMGIRIQR